MDTGNTVLLWGNEDGPDGWVTIATGKARGREYFIMAPPEPTLAEQARYCAIRLRGHAATAAYGDLVDTMADALERGERVEAAARKYMQLWKYGATPAELDAARNVMRDVLEAQ